MIGIVLAILLIPFLGWGITLFPWPDLPSGFQSQLQSLFTLITAFDKVLPIHEMVALFFLTASIELSIWGYNFGASIIGFLTGHQAPRILDNNAMGRAESWYRQGQKKMK